MYGAVWLIYGQYKKDMVVSYTDDKQEPMR